MRSLWIVSAATAQDASQRMVKRHRTKPEEVAGPDMQELPIRARRRVIQPHQL
jgi:hypothetical protein